MFRQSGCGKNFERKLHLAFRIKFVDHNDIFCGSLSLSLKRKAVENTCIFGYLNVALMMNTGAILVWILQSLRPGN